MSANIAINVFAKAVIMHRKIPFEIKASPKTESMSAFDAFQGLRTEALNGGLPEMNLDEINEEIRLTRKELAAKNKVKA